MSEGVHCTLYNAFKIVNKGLSRTVSHKPFQDCRIFFSQIMIVL